MQNEELLKATGSGGSIPREEDGQTLLLLDWFWLGAPSMGEDGALPLPVLSNDSLVSHLAPAAPLLPQGRSHVCCSVGWGLFWEVPLALPLYSSNWEQQRPDPAPARVQFLGGSSEQGSLCSLSPSSPLVPFTLWVLWDGVAPVLQKTPANRWSRIFAAWFVAQPLPLSQLKLALVFTRASLHI